MTRDTYNILLLCHLLLKPSVYILCRPTDLYRGLSGLRDEFPLTTFTDFFIDGLMWENYDLKH